MIVLDTHAWVWAIGKPAELSEVSRAAIAGADEIGVSVMSCWEVATLVRRQRVDLGMPSDVWFELALNWRRVRVLPVTVAIAVAAGSFGDELHGDPMDRLIAATAIEADAPLVTSDARLRSFPRLRTIW